MRLERSFGTFGGKSEPTLRVLIANQDSFSRVYFRRAVLRCTQAEILEAQNGVDALELLSDKTVHVLLLDLEIPVLSGLELLEFIHDDPAHRGIQVIVTTGISADETVRRAIALGVAGYLLKPYQQSLVEQRLAAALARVQTTAEGKDGSSSSSETRLLIADVDSNFCSTVESVLSSVAEVKVVRSVPELLTASLRWKPHLLWLYPQVLGRRMDFVLQKVVGIRRGEEIIIQLISDGSPADKETHPLSKGWVERTFTAAELTKRFYQAINSSETFLAHARNRFEQTQSEVITAVRQVFGMMTGTEAKSVPERPDVVEDLCASLGLKEPRQSVYLQVVLQSSRAMAVQLCVQMTACDPGQVDDEQVDSVLGEMLNMVAGRIKSCYEQFEVELELGLARRIDPPYPHLMGEQHSQTHYFEWQDHAAFTLTVQQGTGEAPQAGPEA